MPDKTTKATSAPKRPWIASLYSALVFPGSGQSYNGQRMKAFLFGAAETILLILVTIGVWNAIAGWINSKPEWSDFVSSGRQGSRGLPIYHIGPLWFWLVLMFANHVISAVDAYIGAPKPPDRPPMARRIG